MPLLRRSRPDAITEAQIEAGGLGVNGLDGQVLHVVPSDVASALRFFVTRRQTSQWLGDHRTLAVTSAIAGEGVSFCARSLAAVIAHDLRCSVCLVETNWWDTPRRQSDASVEDVPGLIDIVTDAADLDDSLIRAADSPLCFLPAGSLTPAIRPVVVASDEFSAVLAKIASRFDTVILDVPPVLGVSEAIRICSCADASILVVRQGVTPERQVAQAVDELRGLVVLGMLLNRSTTSVPKMLRSFTMPT